MKSRLYYAVFCFVLAVILLFVCVPMIERRTYPKTEVLRTTQRVEKGKQLTSEDFEQIEVGMPEQTEGMHLTAEDVIGRYAAVDLVQDDILLLSKLSQLPMEGDLPKNILPEGNTAILLTLKMIEGSEYPVPKAGDVVKLNGFRNKLIDIPQLQFVRVLSVVKPQEEEELVSVTVSVNTEQQEYIKKNRKDTFYASVIVRGNEELAEKLLTEQKAYFKEME